MSTAYTKDAKPTTTYSKDEQDSYLLKQDSFFLLLESGFKIVLARGSLVTTTYTKETKP